MASISRSHIFIFLLSALLFLLYIRFPALLAMHRTETAPLHNCDLPAKDIIPDSYIVYLWPGTTLAQHKAALLPNIDLDRAIDHVMAPILDGGGILYRATLDETALDAVRGDRDHVQLVECNRLKQPSAMGVDL
ncbi:hypothetical protein GE09DRAFT_1160162 [Coniochaeta sp. 2T2.1]|nr:hypothetical protein GE09DRAFT_1160162 [Coniochaeta sp. 2T2.1]